jgi:hypothetical protein
VVAGGVFLAAGALAIAGNAVSWAVLSPGLTALGLGGTINLAAIVDKMVVTFKKGDTEVRAEFEKLQSVYGM